MANRSKATKKAAKTKKHKAAGKKAAKTRKLNAAELKAAETRKRRAAGRKAAQTKKRRAAGRKAAETKKRRAAGQKAAVTKKVKKEQNAPVQPSAESPSVATPEKKDIEPNEKSSPTQSAATGHIVDATEESVGRSIIITGTPEPKK